MDTRPMASKYEAPRAVRLNDANTASLACVPGLADNNTLCVSGFSVQGPGCNMGIIVQTW